ncbi:MAG: LacI family DNA-binding transcriptional regulator [Georgenia sp.]
MARIRLQDVATHAGVSRSTASLVLRGSTRISSGTSARVRASMSELGYVYDRAAANLRGEPSKIVALVMTDLYNPFFATLTMALEDVLHQAGYTLLLGYSRDETARQEELLGAMAERRVDGVLLLPAEGTDQGLVERLEAQGVPTIMFARHVGSSVSYAGPDNREAGRLLGRHLRGVGIRHAALLGGPKDSSARSERAAGLVEGGDGTLDLGSWTVGWSASSAGATTSRVADAVHDLLGRGDWPDCIIGYNDVVASAVSTALREHGVAPGADIAVAGFDDITAAAHQSPPLTTVATHPELVGTACAELLLRRLKMGRAAPPEMRLIAPTLRVRTSTTAWRSRCGTARRSDGNAASPVS